MISRYAATIAGLLVSNGQSLPQPATETPAAATMPSDLYPFDCVCESTAAACICCPKNVRPPGLFCVEVSDCLAVSRLSDDLWLANKFAARSSTLRPVEYGKRAWRNARFALIRLSNLDGIVWTVKFKYQFKGREWVESFSATQMRSYITRPNLGARRLAFKNNYV